MTRRISFAVLLLAACHPVAGMGPPCTIVGANVPLSRDIPESSGLALSRRTPGLLWTHNDSGNEPFIFAVDSIPAIFAITRDPFIVLTSNVFAILGLRAMFFLLQAVAGKFHLLNYGLAVILVFIGTKMMLIDVFKIPVAVSLGVVVGILAITMVWSAKTAPNS